MAAFECFFSFYGLVLGLSVAVLATGTATAIQHRKKIRIGWLTPLLALFVALDVASFWDFAWTNYRDLPFSYGMLIVGLVIALIYFVAASLVFPHEIEDGLSLDDHFKANRRLVLLLTSAANVLAFLVSVPILMGKPEGGFMLANYVVTLGLYLVLAIPAAFVRRKTVFTVLMWTHIALYLIVGVVSTAFPHANDQILKEAARQAEAAKAAQPR